MYYSSNSEVCRFFFHNRTLYTLYTLYTNTQKKRKIVILFGIQFLDKYTKTVYLTEKLYTYTSSIIWYTKYTIKSFKYTVSVYQRKNCIPRRLPIYLILSVIGIQSIQSIQSCSKAGKTVYL